MNSTIETVYFLNQKGLNMVVGFLIFLISAIISFRFYKLNKQINDLKSRLDYKDTVEQSNKRQHDLDVARIDDICEWCKTLEKGRQGNSEDIVALIHDRESLIARFDAHCVEFSNLQKSDQENRAVIAQSTKLVERLMSVIEQINNTQGRIVAALEKNLPELLNEKRSGSTTTSNAH